MGYVSGVVLNVSRKFYVKFELVANTEQMESS